MTSKIWIASKTMVLPGFETIYEHLYLVYDPDGNPTSGDEFVFRGGPKGGATLGNIVIENWQPIGNSKDKLTASDPYASRNYTELNLNGIEP